MAQKLTTGIIWSRATQMATDRVKVDFNPGAMWTQLTKTIKCINFTNNNNKKK